MFEQDYIMRLIKEMIRMALKLLFHIDTDSPTAELLEEKAEKGTLDRLLDLVDSGSVWLSSVIICCKALFIFYKNFVKIIYFC